MRIESTSSTIHQIFLHRDRQPNKSNIHQIDWEGLEGGEKIVPFGATSCSSPFLKGVLDLNPFHQFVNEVFFEGEVAADVRDEGCDTGGDNDVCSCRGCGGACCCGCCGCSDCGGCDGGGMFVG